jgi:hypothetical protein
MRVTSRLFGGPDLASDVTTHRQRMTAEALIMGPTSIYIRRDSTDYERLCDFEQVLRVIVRTAGTVTSWSVYKERQNRPHERIPGCVLRHVVWDKEAPAADSGGSEGIPGLSSTTQYLTGPPCALVTRDCKDLARVLLAGVPFTPRPGDTSPHWYQISIYCSLEVEIKLSWPSNMQNEACEAAIFKVASTIGRILAERVVAEQQKIEAMEFVYRSNLPLDLLTTE